MTQQTPCREVRQGSGVLREDPPGLGDELRQKFVTPQALMASVDSRSSDLRFHSFRHLHHRTPGREHRVDIPLRSATARPFEAGVLGPAITADAIGHGYGLIASWFRSMLPLMQRRCQSAENQLNRVASASQFRIRPSFGTVRGGGRNVSSAEHGRQRDSYNLPTR